MKPPSKTNWNISQLHSEVLELVLPRAGRKRNGKFVYSFPIRLQTPEAVAMEALRINKKDIRAAIRYMGDICARLRRLGGWSEDKPNNMYHVFLRRHQQMMDDAFAQLKEWRPAQDSFWNYE